MNVRYSVMKSINSLIPEVPDITAFTVFTYCLTLYKDLFRPVMCTRHH
jgi:hypothetical protein